MTVVALIPARLDSTRLPRKQLREIAGRPMIDYLAARMAAVPAVDEVAVATTDRPIDDELASWADRMDVGCYRGDLADVLGRLTAAADAFDADVVVRANGDNPLLAPEVTAAGLGALKRAGDEYVTGKNMFTGIPVGLGPGIIETDTLVRLSEVATAPYHREHVTTYVFENPDEFDWSPIPVESGWIARELSLTVDTAEQFEYAAETVDRLPGGQSGEWSVKDIIAAAEEVDGT
ncbi:cytidylyltransferase domain-containing protein [Halosimplex salinum]|uniref:cytidylyltransferase domain-containing protein n=1 Tax=Halosimplex salinum TaxID=1710538 RepID=UPI000F48E841|nr:NTP transferase domain-containing protein [Halosimplex salinum]